MRTQSLLVALTLASFVQILASLYKGRIMQLDLFTDTGEGCSFVARPVRTNTDGLPIDGETYEPIFDEVRLGRQALAVFHLMKDGKWRTLREVTEAIGGGSEAGVSARLRDFRKSSFGGHVVNRRRRGAESSGVFEYQVICK